MTQRKRLLQDRRFYLIVNISPTRGLSDRLEYIIRNGVDILQLRCSKLPDTQFLRAARRLRKLTSAHDIVFIVNNRPDIAILSDADGLHVGQDDISPASARKILGKDKLIGLSTHTLSQIKDTSRVDGLNYIGIGPIFKTATKPDTNPIGLGIIRVASQYKEIPPFFAIGGITIDNIDSLVKVGVKRIAVSSSVFDSSNPVETIKKFRMRLNDAD